MPAISKAKQQRQKAALKAHLVLHSMHLTNSNFDFKERNEQEEDREEEVDDEPDDCFINEENIDDIDLQLEHFDDPLLLNSTASVAIQYQSSSAMDSAIYKSTLFQALCKLQL